MIPTGFPTTLSDLDGPASHARLVEELKSGNSTAFQWIVDTFREPLLAFAQRKMNGVGDAEDVVQEAFVRFWSNRNRLQPDGCVRALLFCTVRTLVTDEHRRRARRNRCVQFPPLLSSGDSPLDALLSTELERIADSAIHRFPPRRKTVWQMVREGGLTHREAADALGVSPQTVANTMSTAMADLRASLKPILEEAS